MPRSYCCGFSATLHHCSPIEIVEKATKVRIHTTQSTGMNQETLRYLIGRKQKLNDIAKESISYKAPETMKDVKGWQMFLQAHLSFLQWQ